MGKCLTGQMTELSVELDSVLNDHECLVWISKGK